MKKNKKLSHLDEAGRARMVDVGEKKENYRVAYASAKVRCAKETVEKIRENRIKKGGQTEIFSTARIAGIQAAKKTSELIPLCHPLRLTRIRVDCELKADGVLIESEVSAMDRTGVEMEALTAAAVAALTIYDMAKAVEKGMVIEWVRLEKKIGGKSGVYQRACS